MNTTMRNNTCIICGKEFEPRKGKFYCSNTCRQKGYEDRKALKDTDSEEKSESKEVPKKSTGLI